MSHPRSRAAWCWLLLVGALTMSALTTSAWVVEPDPVQPWRQNVKIGPVSRVVGRHSIHAYYVCNPESPDQKSVVFFTSTDPAGHVGEIRILDRATQQETVLAENVQTEDAHRAACQQWLSNGKRVAFHEFVEGRWRVVAIDVTTKEKTIVAWDRQVGFGQGTGDLLPIYGCHWNPGAHRDVEIWEASTGQIRTAVRFAEVVERHKKWVAQEFDGRASSLYFAVLSPDLQQVFFKVAAAGTGHDFRSKNASVRQGLLAANVKAGESVLVREKWGHPAWFPDSRRILEMSNIFLDSRDGAVGRIPNLPVVRGSHPTVSPDGRLYATDGLVDNLGGPAGEWGILVGDLQGTRSQLLTSFDNSRGATSWRRNHPHPVFSRDSRRIYFNVNDGEFTRLLVAERTD